MTENQKFIISALHVVTEVVAYYW